MKEFCGNCAYRTVYPMCTTCIGGSKWYPLKDEKKSAKDCCTCMHKDSTAGAEICEICTIRGDEPPTNWEQLP